jgi:YidC/Oxa1 family membrane protein insertase
MEKRVLLAVFLSFLVLYVYDAAVRPRKQPTPAAQSGAARPPAAPQAAEQSPTAAPRAAPEAPAAALAEPVAAPVDTGTATVGEVAERSITVETSTVTATLTNRGGQITGWRLKHYSDERGGPVDLVPAALPAATPRPLALQVKDAGVTRQLNAALYRVTQDGAEAANTIHVSKPTSLVFEFQNDSGLQVRKTLTFEPTGYIFGFSASASSSAGSLNPAVKWGPGLGDTISIAGEGSSFSTYVQKPQGILFRNGKAERLPLNTIQEQSVYEGEFGFAGIDDHYFIATLIEPGSVRIQYEPILAPLEGSDQKRELLAWNMSFPRPPDAVRVFFGPKDFDVLAAVDRTLVKAIHFGIWDFFAVPLLRALKWINAYVGNYGWSIIILTVLINLLMFPLRHKSVVSMRKMQELQPQVKAIQERYSKYKATDPERQKMNQELMGLYREKGVNPASGCVPMLLTMPVLFAFYSLLSVAIEMRGAPFGLWIQDLSVHDPYYITPLIMGATMLVQQRMTPIADPAQQKVMMLTPVIFLFFFLWAPSGLVIYWTVSNMLAIGQQYVTNRIIGAPVARQVRPPAERRVKNVGAGSTEGARKA